jgi:hypothetical protein
LAGLGALMPDPACPEDGAGLGALAEDGFGVPRGGFGVVVDEVETGGFDAAGLMDLDTS